jgi:hypothetical protein
MATRGDYVKSLAIVELAVAMLLALPCCVFLKVILFPPRGDFESGGWAGIGLVLLLPAFVAFAVAGGLLLRPMRWRWYAQLLPLAAIVWLFAAFQ